MSGDSVSQFWIELISSSFFFVFSCPFSCSCYFIKASFRECLLPFPIPMGWMCCTSYRVFCFTRHTFFFHFSRATFSTSNCCRNIKMLSEQRNSIDTISLHFQYVTHSYNSLLISRLSIRTPNIGKNIPLSRDVF